MTFWPSPGRLDLASACGFPWATHAPRWPKREWQDNDAAAFGRAFASGVEASLHRQPWAPPADMSASDVQRLTLTIDAAVRHVSEDLAPERYACEVAYLYEVRTGRVRRADRDAVMRPPSGCIGGALDLVTLGPRGLVVTDWKTGRSRGDAASSWQLRMYALWAARDYGVEDVTVEMAYPTPDGCPTDPARLDGLELALLESDLRTLLERLPASVPRAGSHCHDRYCPIVAVCPITQRSLAQIEGAADAATRLPLVPTIETPEQAARVRRGLKMVEAALPTFRSALEAYVAQHGPVDMGDGTMFGAVQHEGRRRVDVSVPGALSTVRAYLGEYVDDALEVSTSKAGIERAMRRKLSREGMTERGALSRAMAPLMAELTASGAVKVGAPWTTYEEIRPRAADGDGEAQGGEEAAE